MFINKYSDNKLYAIVLPTKIERDMWYYSIKNMKKELLQFDYDELKITNLDNFNKISIPTPPSQ